MKYKVTYIFDETDVNSIIEDFEHYHKIKITEKQAIRIIKHYTKWYGLSFLHDTRVEDISVKDPDIEKILNIK